MEYTTKLNNTTKKAQYWIKQYEESNCYTVKNFYGRCSDEKKAIEEEIIKKMYDNNCYGYKVLSGNCFHFVCGYMDKEETTLYIETIGNTWEIKL